MTFTNGEIFVWWAFTYIRSRSKQTKTVKTQDLILSFLTEPLIYNEMGDMSASVSKGHAYRSQSRTLDYGKKSQSQLAIKRVLVLCVLFLKSSKCMGDSTIELVFNPCGGESSRERGVITVH